MPEAGVYGFSFIFSFIHLTFSTMSHVPETVIELDDKIIRPSVFPLKRAQSGGEEAGKQRTTVQVCSELWQK